MARRASISSLLGFAALPCCAGDAPATRPRPAATAETASAEPPVSAAAVSAAAAEEPTFDPWASPVLTLTERTSPPTREPVPATQYRLCAHAVEQTSVLLFPTSEVAGLVRDPGAPHCRISPRGDFAVHQTASVGSLDTIVVRLPGQAPVVRLVGSVDATFVDQTTLWHRKGTTAHTLDVRTLEAEELGELPDFGCSNDDLLYDASWDARQRACPGGLYGHVVGRLPESERWLIAEVDVYDYARRLRAVDPRTQATETVWKPVAPVESAMLTLSPDARWLCATNHDRPADEMRVACGPLRGPLVERARSARLVLPRFLSEDRVLVGGDGRERRARMIDLARGLEVELDFPGSAKSTFVPLPGGEHLLAEPWDTLYLDLPRRAYWQIHAQGTGSSAYMDPSDATSVFELRLASEDAGGPRLELLRLTFER